MSVRRFCEGRNLRRRGEVDENHLELEDAWSMNEM